MRLASALPSLRYGAASTDSERALGSIGSNSAGNIVYGAQLTNGLGGDADFFVLQYTGEQWRNGGNTTAHKLSFDYSLDATSLSTGTWTSVTLLDFTGPVHTASAGALNGNQAANRETLNQLVNLSSLWTSGSDLWIRWTASTMPETTTVCPSTIYRSFPELSQFLSLPRWSPWVSAQWR